MPERLRHEAIPSGRSGPCFLGLDRVNVDPGSINPCVLFLGVSLVLVGSQTVVQWHQLFFPFLDGCSTKKLAFPKKGSLFFHVDPGLIDPRLFIWGYEGVSGFSGESDHFWRGTRPYE